MKNIKFKILYSVVAIGLAALNVQANELSEPSVFVSNKNSKVLDLLIIAKAAPIDALPGVTGGWVYEICERKFSMGNACLPGKSNFNRNPYGGARLQLSPGDTLKVHLVNKLPQIPESSHKDEPGEAFLLHNPTNLHTHGLLVSPSKPADKESPKYGDNIFVLTFNSANGQPHTESSFHMHGDVQNDWTDYQIVIPEHHPSGLYWFHPHAHGIALNQISAGLSGILTIGQVTDYMPRLSAGVKTRHLILKDTQVNGSALQTQQDPGFCDGASITEPGFCSVNGVDKWYFTVNGQLNPTINVKSDGEIWRITNSSGSVTYDLQLAKQFKNNDAPIALQLLSVDGVSVTPVDSTNSELKEIGGAKFKPVPCTGINTNSPKAVCISKLTMMPSSRAEILVVNRDADGKVIDADNSSAIFRTIGYKTGVDADNWPAIDLAQVQFSGREHVNHEPVVEVSDSRHNGDGLKLNAIAKDLAAANAAVGPDSDPDCVPLPTGWKRRIYYGVPTDAEFGLGFELVDDKGKTVPNSFQEVSAFNMHSKGICVTLAAGNKPAFENWELINLASEDHNFHIHQTKFRVVADSEKKRTRKANFARGILQDNLPLLSGGDGCDGTVAAWKSGVCKTSPSVVEIPFVAAGNFVYHCHILEHEDGGMMAAIRVVGANK